MNIECRVTKSGKMGWDEQVGVSVLRKYGSMKAQKIYPASCIKASGSPAVSYKIWWAGWQAGKKRYLLSPKFITFHAAVKGQEGLRYFS